MAHPSPGTLFVVATPIGNLEDLTFRALRILREVDLIAAEDTRRTSKLLAHYHVRKPMVSLRAHNEAREAPRLLDRIAAGQSIALVSDAGTPGIADPGTRLVQAAHERAVVVVPVPGPNAIAAALSVSGFPADRFVFLGFPPSSGLARQRWFKDLIEEPSTLVFFEAPHRILDAINRLNSIERPNVVLREMTKVHEQLVHRPNKTPPIDIRHQGEFTIVIAPVKHPEVEVTEGHQALSGFGRLTESAGFSEDEALVMLAARLGLSSSQVRKLIKRARISVKQQNVQPHSADGS